MRWHYAINISINVRRKNVVKNGEEPGTEIGERKGEDNGTAMKIVDKLLPWMSVQEIISEGYRKEAVLKAERIINKRK